MRKVLAVLMMLLIGSIYVLSIKKEDSKVLDNHMKQEKSNSTERLDQIEEVLVGDYPTMPKDIIGIHNELMQQQYGKTADVEQLDELVSVIRELYSKELLALNTYELQLEATVQEVLANTVQELFLVSSEIEAIEFIEQHIAIVEVTHYMTSDSIGRVYYLVKEEGKWKIHNWTDK